MINNLDVGALLAKLNNGELTENINRLSQLLNAPETDENEEQAISASITDNAADPLNKEAYVNHHDPRINLLIAITPFLSTAKRNKAEMLLKPLNLLYFLRQFDSLAEQVEKS
ncbi:MAG TPA: hypothetical protein VFC74_03405 [Oscillospiraceae bacterium]|nr:hypothetical protein [Oscillospiraceae bacterium]